MIIKYLNDGTLAVDKSVSLDNSFQLAKYEKDDTKVKFKANVVVEKHTMLITLMQVTRYGKNDYGTYLSDSTCRKRWLEDNFHKFEQAVKKHLSKNNYKGKVEIRLKITNSNIELFKDLGYAYTGEHVEGTNYWQSPFRPSYFIYNKTI